MFGIAFRLYFHFNIELILKSKSSRNQFQKSNLVILKILNNIIFRVNTQQGAILCIKKKIKIAAPFASYQNEDQD
jgi:hypothetical protein